MYYVANAMSVSMSSMAILLFVMVNTMSILFASAVLLHVHMYIRHASYLLFQMTMDLFSFVFFIYLSENYLQI